MVDPKRRRDHSDNVDVERGDPDPRVDKRDGDLERTVEPEDEDRRVRPGEKRPERIMP